MILYTVLGVTGFAEQFFVNVVSDNGDVSLNLFNKSANKTAKAIPSPFMAYGFAPVAA